MTTPRISSSKPMPLKATKQASRSHPPQQTQASSSKRWDDYEIAWTTLLRSTEEMTFASIPWPVSKSVICVEDLNQNAISDFLFGSLSPSDPEGNITRRTRIRASLLRWHPDKMQTVLNRAKDGEADKIKEGIDAVTHVLLHLQVADKANAYEDNKPTNSRRTTSNPFAGTSFDQDRHATAQFSERFWANYELTVRRHAERNAAEWAERRNLEEQTRRKTEMKAEQIRRDAEVRSEQSWKEAKERAEQRRRESEVWTKRSEPRRGELGNTGLLSTEFVAMLQGRVAMFESLSSEEVWERV